MNSDIYYHGPVVCLDLDDTLYPEVDFVFSAFRAIADSLQRRDSLDPAATLKVMQRAHRIGNNPFDELLAAFPQISHKDLFVPMCVEIYRFHQPDLSLPAESLEFLQLMRDRGVKMVLVTDGRATTQWAKIRALGLEEYFDPQDIWVSEERGMGKLTFDPWKHAVDRYPEAKGFFALGDNPTKDFYNPNLLGFTTICLLDRGDNIHPQDTIPTPQHAASQLVGSLREAAEIILK